AEMTIAIPATMPAIGSGNPTARRFTGKDCVITGGGSGIGRAAALRIAAEGGRIAVLDLNADAARETLAMSGSDGLAAELDVRSEASVKTAAALVASAFQGVDVLVNNAGIEILGTIDEMAPDVWDEIMAVNLRGPYLTSRTFLPQLLARADAKGGAAIVHNASLMGLVSSPGLAAYCASKAGLVSLTRSMALDYATRNLRVNCVCPGIIHTPMLERRFAMQPDRAEAYRTTSRRPPVHYIGNPEDVGAAIAYLASDEARFVTGSALTIDGGVGAA
ncbi:MAG: 3-oxoacyl-[acyl-carrier protein] reductase, partial [Devosia sp.]|uniref:SDR family NAD(P)-dependent oxidoreductase n=1 Tax=Devosia sp. TaxID=1871048 RepID=UPI002625EE39